MRFKWSFWIVSAAVVFLSSKLSTQAFADSVPTAVKTVSPLAKIPAQLQAKIIKRYSEIVYESYRELKKTSEDLNQDIQDFVRNPSVKTQEKAKQSWKTSRMAYSLTEPYRYYAGPIDDPKTGVEGLMNAWPIDEAYLDSVKGNPDAGIVNNSKLFPKITKEVLLSMNQKDGEKNVSTGYHAIEFLLWGQNFSITEAGTRGFEDYIDNGKNNALRRGTLLKLLGEILVENCAYLTQSWDPAVKGNYVEKFLATDSAEVLRRVFTGLASLTVDELAGERMIVALEKNDTKRQQDCFSDFTTFDLVQNAIAIRDVFLGHFKNSNGPGLIELVKTIDPPTAKKLSSQLDNSVTTVRAIPFPFDAILASPPHSPGRKKVLAAIDSLETQGKLFAKAGRLLGLTLNVQE